MADGYCAQCSMAHFDGEDYGDFVRLCSHESVINVVCEGCGPTWVDKHGRSIDIEATANAYRGPGEPVRMVIR